MKLFKDSCQCTGQSNEIKNKERVKKEKNYLLEFVTLPTSSISFQLFSNNCSMADAK